MKIICTDKNWPFQQTDTAKKLIQTVLDNDLVPRSMQSQFTSLSQMLESGTPTARNKQSGHGMGATTVVVTDYFRAYGLSTAAANITLMVSAFEAMK